MRNLFLILLLVGCPLDTLAGESRIVERTFLSIPYVALTFDACPTKKKIDLDERVLKILGEKKVPATFFMSGRWAKKNASTVSQLSKDPLFEIGNHGFRHFHMMKRDSEFLKKDLLKTQRLIEEITGTPPKYFRPPYGEVDAGLVKAASQLGLTTIQFSLESGDPNAKLSKKALVHRVLSKTTGGGIIVFHMNRNGLHTAEALPEIIEGLRKRGFVLVTVDELLRQEQIALERIKKLLAAK